LSVQTLLSVSLEEAHERETQIDVQPQLPSSSVQLPDERCMETVEHLRHVVVVLGLDF